MNQKTGRRAIETKGLEVGYRGNGVVSNIDLVLPMGSFISLLGPNGAGKTTLLRSLARLLPPLKGVILVKERGLEGFPSHEFAKLLSIVLTDKVQPGLFSVFEFVALGRYPHTNFMGRLTESDRRVILESLSMVHAEDLATRRLETLSDGERQKVLIARALAQEPDIIILDEPTLHLDLKHSMEVMAILQELCRKRGITVVASLHDVGLAARLSDQVVLVKDGGILGCGPPEELLERRTITHLFDLVDADFDPDLGYLEMKGSRSRGRVFVAAGMASGAGLFRSLVRYGFFISTGVLHENDLDYHVALAIGACIAGCPPMEAIDEERIEKALRLVKQAPVFVDSGFKTGPLNRLNLELVKRALDMGCTVFSLRQAAELEKYVGRDATKITLCHGIPQLLDSMENMSL